MGSTKSFLPPCSGVFPISVIKSTLNFIMRSKIYLEISLRLSRTSKDRREYLFEHHKHISIKSLYTRETIICSEWFKFVPGLDPKHTELESEIRVSIPH